MTWQVTTLEQSLKLKELGITQNSSVFYWNRAKSGPHKESVSLYWSSDSIAAAFTVGELGVMFPYKHPKISHVSSYRSAMTGLSDFFSCSYEKKQAVYEYFPVLGQTEAIARANMIFHLIENSLITVAECNARLEAVCR